MIIHSAQSVRDRQQGILWAIGLFSLIINLLMLSGPLFMLQVYDRVLTSGSLPTLTVLLVLVGVLFMIMGLLDMIRSRLLLRIGMRFDAALSRQAFLADSGGLALPAIGPAVQPGGRQSGGRESGRRQKAQAGRGAAPDPDGSMIARLDTIRQFLTSPAPAAWFDAPWIPVNIGVLYALHPTLGLFAIAATGLLAIIALTTDWLTRGPHARAAPYNEVARTMLNAGRQNHDVVQAMGMTRGLMRVWQQPYRLRQYYQAKASDRASGMQALTKSVRLFLQSAMLALAAMLAIEQKITAGTIIATSILLGRALAPVEQGIGQWRGVLNARAAFRALCEAFPEDIKMAARTLLPKPAGQIETANLRVIAPQAQRLLLTRVQFGLKPGEALAIVGPSGAGKSSLLRALAGIWPVAGGEIRLDGATHEQWDKEQLGAEIGYLPQDSGLLTGTVKENIQRFGGDEGADPEADRLVIEAARAAGAHEMILALPDGYETRIGPLGENLSAGQSKRVALARAFYGNPAFLFLDEPNTHLDMEGDLALMTSLNNWRKAGRTVIFTTHRASFARSADKVLILRDGQQVQFGATAEILGPAARPVMPDQNAEQKNTAPKKVVR